MVLYTLQRGQAQIPRQLIILPYYDPSSPTFQSTSPLTTEQNLDSICIFTQQYLILNTHKNTHTHFIDLGMIDYKEALHLWKEDRSDFWMLMATFIITLTMGIETGMTGQNKG